MAEDWGQRVLDKVAAKNAVKGNRGGAIFESVFAASRVRTHLMTSAQMTAWLLAASKAINLNRSTFIRRAVAVQIAHTLNLPLSTVLRQSPAEGKYGHVQDWRGGYDSGAGIEHFCPHPGCDGRHLRG